MSAFGSSALRGALTAANAIRSAVRHWLGQDKFGAHAIAITPQGAVVLVKLRYAPGWRVPGGARSRDEDPVKAALRELREEIGLVSSGEAARLADMGASGDIDSDSASLVVVRDVRYRPPRWSWEVEDICEAELSSLPHDTSVISARWIEAVRPLL